MSRTFKEILTDSTYCAALAAVALLLILPWRPDVSYDNFAYYYPALRAFADHGYSLYDIFISPFYIPDTGELIQADQSKPVFIAALRLWACIVHLLSPRADVPGAGMYHGFMFVSCWLMGITMVTLGRVMGHAASGRVTAAVVVMSPWHLVLLYYPAYTQLSIAVFIAAFLCVRHNSRRSVFFAGAISAAALLTNSSLLVYLAGLTVLAAVLNRFHWERAVSRVCLYLLGLTSVLVMFELGKMIVLPLAGQNPDQYLSPLETLVRYFHRSLTANHFQTSDIPKFPGLMAHILRFNSVMATLGIAVAGVIVIVRALTRKGKGLSSPGVLLAIPAVVAIVLIDFGPGVQLGRSYFVAYPMLVMAAVFIWRDMIQRTVAMKAACAVVLVLYGAELAGLLVTQRAAFHSAGREVCEALAKGSDVAVLERDAHRHAIVLLAAGECGKRSVSGEMTFIADVSQTEADVLVTGPLIDTVWHVGVEDSFQSSQNRERPAGMEGPRYVRQMVRPFFGLYPLIVFEDEKDTFRYMNGAFTAETFAGPVGGMSVWRLKL